MLEKLYTKRKGRTVQCQIRFFEVLSCEISQTDSSETNIIWWRKSEFCRTWATSTLVRRSLCTPHRRLQRSDMRLSRNTGGKNQIIPYSSSTLLSLFTDVWHSFSLTLRTLWGLGQSRASVLTMCLSFSAVQHAFQPSAIFYLAFTLEVCFQFPYLVKLVMWHVGY